MKETEAGDNWTAADASVLDRTTGHRRAASKEDIDDLTDRLNTLAFASRGGYGIGALSLCFMAGCIFGSLLAWIIA